MAESASACFECAKQGMAPVETVRRYSKLQHLWRSSKRLAKLLALPAEYRPEPDSARRRVHKLHQRLADETVAALISDYRDGSSLAALLRTYSLSRGSVQKLLRERGVRRRRKSLTDDEVAVLAEQYKQGCTIREIAAEQDLPKSTVQDALSGAGIAMRSASRRR